MKCIKSFSKFMMLIASVFFMVVFSTNTANAAFYEPANDKVVSYKMDRTTDKLEVSIQYQLGIKDVVVYICTKNDIQSSCTDDGYKSKYVDQLIKGEDSAQINRSEEPTVITLEFVSATDGEQLSEYRDEVLSNGKVDSTYRIMVEAKFCSVRTADHLQCNTWVNDGASILVLNEQFELNKGITNSSELNQTLAEMLNIVNNIVIPAMWALLAVLLIIRGILLGIDIVKLADEPEARKNKVNGLVWLIIGVAAGYGITIAASLVMSSFGYGGYF